jgi:type II secretory pathway pseudopilin PulG
VTAKHRRGRRDDTGFTLVETVVVVTVMAVIAITLAATMSVIFRTAPSTEARTDDSRSLLGLTNRLSQDVTSTAEDRFEFGDHVTKCDTATVPTSIGIVQLSWTDDSATYVSDYRYVPVDSDHGVLRRFACLEGDAPQVSTLTATLRNNPLDGTPPILVIPVATTMYDGTPGYKGLQFSVRVYDDDGSQRELLNLDATTANVQSELTALPPGPGGPNVAPDAPDVSVSVAAGGSVDVTLPATDPNTDPLTITFPSPPAGWTLVVTGLTATITPPPTFTGAADITYRATDRVGDSDSLSDDGIIHVDVVAAPANQPPTVDAVSAVAQPATNVAVTVTPTDSDGPAPMVLTIPSLPSGWSVSIVDMTATFTVPTTATGSYSIDYTVTDDGGAGASATSTITIGICEARFQSGSAGLDPSTVNVKTNGSLESHLQVGIENTTSCGPLVVTFLPVASQSTPSQEAFGTGTTLTINKNSYTWTDPSPSTREVTLTLRLGSNGAQLDTRTLTTT